jgi:hypothetical protein
MEGTMLEQLHTTPEERRKTEIILHAGTVAFALFNFAELVGRLGAAPVIAGTAVGLSGLFYSQWLRSRWRDDLHRMRDEPHDAAGRYPLRVM